MGCAEPNSYPACSTFDFPNNVLTASLTPNFIYIHVVIEKKISSGQCHQTSYSHKLS